MVTLVEVKRALNGLTMIIDLYGGTHEALQETQQASEHLGAILREKDGVGPRQILLGSADNTQLGPESRDALENLNECIKRHWPD